jgi:hypothetical protein
MKYILVVLALCGVIGCPHSSIYRPSAERLRAYDEQADRWFFPDDVRRDPDAASQKKLLWTGIIREQTRVSTPRGDAIEFRVEHHYWDFVLDYGAQLAHAFLSPRGEGSFVVRVSANELEADPKNFREGWMLLAWGSPHGVLPDGTVRLDMQASSGFPPGFFSTEMWDYGRAYLLQHDTSDWKVLRLF